MGTHESVRFEYLDVVFSLMSLGRRIHSALRWTLLVGFVLHCMPIAAQTGPAAPLKKQKRPPEDSAPNRPTRFNATPIGGTGLLQAISPYTLSPGIGAFGASVTNYDRDPGDIDFFQYGFQGSIGLPKRMEFFVRTMPWFRVNSANLDPLAFPVPPLDLFVDTYPTSAVRTGPKFLYSPQVPYKTYNLANLTETGAFSDGKGNNVFGGKINLRSEDRGDVIGLGVRGFIEVPVEKPLYNAPYPAFRNLAGVSGKVNYGGDLLFSRTWRAGEFVANLGYKQTGNPDRGLRVQMVDSSQTDPSKFLVGAPVNLPLVLSNELRFSAGYSVPFFHFYKSYWWLITEFNHTHFVGSHTPTERLVHPAEVSAGIQSNFPWYRNVSLGAMWQLLLNDGGKGQLRYSSFKTPDGRGDINFSEFINNPELTAEVEAFLESHGATFTEASSKVFATNNPAFDAWRNIPVTGAKIQSQGHTGILVFTTWRIGGKH
jgi:hypothetical protein